MTQLKQREAHGPAADLYLSNTVVTPRELTEKELNEVSGGTDKFKFTTTTKDKIDTYSAF